MLTMIPVLGVLPGRALTAPGCTGGVDVVLGEGDPAPQQPLVRRQLVDQPGGIARHAHFLIGHDEQEVGAPLALGADDCRKAQQAGWRQSHDGGAAGDFGTLHGWHSPHPDCRCCGEQPMYRQVSVKCQTVVQS